MSSSNQGNSSYDSDNDHNEETDSGNDNTKVQSKNRKSEKSNSNSKSKKDTKSQNDNREVKNKKEEKKSDRKSGNKKNTKKSGNKSDVSRDGGANEKNKSPKNSKEDETDDESGDRESDNNLNSENNDNDDDYEDQKDAPTDSSAYHRKVDRYGTFIQENSDTTEDERQLLEEESRKEFTREMKWAYMTKNWKTTPPKVLHRRIKKGIPDGMRSLVWRLLLDPDSQDDKIYNFRPSIKSLIAKGRQECCNIIEVDLPRTMPQMEMFQKGDAINSLRSILHAYSNYDPTLGYTQGMAFYAAMLLCYMEERQSFWCFVSLMKGKKHHLRNFFSPGFPGLDKIGKVWEYVLNHHYKRVAKRLEDIGLSTIMYVPSWFMCNFFNMPFPMVLKLRLFDCFLGFGTRAIFSFALTIIKMNKDLLLTNSMEDCLQILQRPYEFPRMKNWRVVVRHWQENFLTEAQYKGYFKKAGVKYIP